MVVAEVAVVIQLSLVQMEYLEPMLTAVAITVVIALVMPAV